MSRSSNQLNTLFYSRMNEKRETFFEDRTKCHADHVGQGLDRQTTAAVGVLKAVQYAEVEEEEEDEEGEIKEKTWTM